MLLPSVVIKHSAGGTGLAGCFRRGAATEGLVNAASVVINPERFEFLVQVDRVPEEYAIEILASDGPNQAFDERMRDRRVRNRLDLLDIEDAQVGEPAVESKQWVVVGAGVPGQALVRSGAIEHPAHRDAVDAGGFDAEADDAAREDIPRSDRLR